MRLETLTVEEFNRYLQKSNFHPTADYEVELRERVFRKLITSTINAAVKKIFDKPSVKLDVKIDDAKAAEKNEVTLNLQIEINELEKENNDEFHEIDISKTSKIMSNSDFDRAA